MCVCVCVKGGRANIVWDGERKKDGLEEENGIKRIQMEEWETDRHTDTHKNTETNKKVHLRQPKKHTAYESITAPNSFMLMQCVV